MRTTLVLDDELIRIAQEFTGVSGKTALIREALKALVERESTRRMGEEEHYSERRRDPRKQCFVAVELYPEDTSDCILGSVIDISSTGCCVDTPAPMNIGASVRINPLGYARELCVVGKVVNQRPNRGMWFHTQGIEFSATNDSGVLPRFIEFVEQVSALDPRPPWYFKGGKS